MWMSLSWIFLDTTFILIPLQKSMDTEPTTSTTLERQVYTWLKIRLKLWLFSSWLHLQAWRKGEWPNLLGPSWTGLSSCADLKIFLIVLSLTDVGRRSHVFVLHNHLAGWVFYFDKYKSMFQITRHVARFPKTPNIKKILNQIVTVQGC